MAKVNRNRKLWLSEAWQYYWRVLFPEGDDWCADLEAEIRRRLYFPGDTHDFVSGKTKDIELPRWANALNLRVVIDKVAIKFGNTDFGSVPLFPNLPIDVLSNWADKNPFDAVSGVQAMADRDRNACQGLAVAAVRTCGSVIQNRLLRLLKETEHPDFEIFCRPSQNILAIEKKLPVIGLSEVGRIDIPQNALLDRLGLPKFSYVKIKLHATTKSKAEPHGSFDKTDDDLVEQMKQLIDTGKASSVRQAAKMVSRQALRRPKTSDESVEERLQRKFSRKYPNYISRKGK